VTIGLEHYLALSAILFSIGLYGVLAKRNAVIVLMCIEIMLNAVNIALVAFSRFVTPVVMTGQVFSLFIMIVAAAEAAVAVGIIMAIYRNRASINIDDINLMKW
jgi:NAD(P)H-quinone oxidoreductase subunit 4L